MRDLTPYFVTPYFAHASGHYSYAEIGHHFGLHFTQVGRIVRRQRQRSRNG